MRVLYLGLSCLRIASFPRSLHRAAQTILVNCHFGEHGLPTPTAPMSPILKALGTRALWNSQIGRDHRGVSTAYLEQESP